MNKIVILASGTGSNFCAITDAVQRGDIPDTQIAALLTNKAEAKVVQEAKKRNIPSIILDSKDFRGASGKFHRSEYEKQLLSELHQLSPDWICLAGYMLVLGKEIIEAFPKRILNIHPSLLPKYPGLHAVEQALRAGEKETGCTVHYVTLGVDEGPVILQERIPVLQGDTAETVLKRLHPIEHATYIQALKKVIDRKERKPQD